jgi:hypothetical protein
MPAWKSKRVQKTKKNKGRWSKLKDSKSKSKSRSRKRDSIKPHYTRRVSRSSKGDRDEFSKFLKSKRRTDAWKPNKTRKIDSPKSKKSKTVKKSKKQKRWATDWNFSAMMEVSDDSLERHNELMNKTAKPAVALGLPNWPPKAPSPSKLPPPSFKPSISPSPSINLTEDDFKVLSSAVKDAFKSKSPKPTLLRPMDITGVKSKRNPELLTPAQITLLAPSDISKKVAKGTKKRKKRKRRKTKKQKGGKIPSTPPPGIKRKTKKLPPPGISHKRNRTRKIHNLVGKLRSKSEPIIGKTDNKIKIRRTKSEPNIGKNKRLVDLKVQAKIAAALASDDARNNSFAGNSIKLLQGLHSTQGDEEIGLNEDDLKLIKNNKKRQSI